VTPAAATRIALGERLAEREPGFVIADQADKDAGRAQRRDIARHIAGAADLDRLQGREGRDIVITPHPGEMARLIGKPVTDRVTEARSFAAFPIRQESLPTRLTCGR
jgi:hypothetical protein